MVKTDTTEPTLDEHIADVLANPLPIDPTVAPVFDFDRFSWRDAKNFATLQAKLSGAETIEEVETITADLQALMRKVLVSLPPTWFVTDAPPDPLSLPDALEWLKSHKFRALISAITDGMATESAGKN